LRLGLDLSLAGKDLYDKQHARITLLGYQRNNGFSLPTLNDIHRKNPCLRDIIHRILMEFSLRLTPPTTDFHSTMIQDLVQDHPTYVLVAALLIAVGGGYLWLTLSRPPPPTTAAPKFAEKVLLEADPNKDRSNGGKAIPLISYPKQPYACMLTGAGVFIRMDRRRFRLSGVLSLYSPAGTAQGGSLPSIPMGSISVRHRIRSGDSDITHGYICVCLVSQWVFALCHGQNGLN
jgi:hypothetical protein